MQEERSTLCTRAPQLVHDDADLLVDVREHLFRPARHDRPVGGNGRVDVQEDVRLEFRERPLRLKR